MLELRNICHRYDKSPLLRDFSLTLAPGQRLAIMGPSGCGKTTLLRIALGLIKPNSGTVRNEFDRTAVVFQEPRLLPWRTAAENVNLVLGDGAQTLPQARQTLAMLGLEEAADKYPPQLSGGMQQRVSIARALTLDAPLLILDEPFKAMDEALRHQVIDQVGQRADAILLVTHEPWEAQALGCEILTLENA